MVLLEPALVSDFDGHIGISFALSDEPLLLLTCDAATLAKVLARLLSQGCKAVLLVMIPPVFKGAQRITATMIARPSKGGSPPECICKGGTFFKALSDVRDDAVADQGALFLWSNGVLVWHAGRCIPTASFEKVKGCVGSFDRGLRALVSVV